MSDTERITVGETVDGDPVSLPVVDVLTGRGFLTGKSGSGKSNTASVVLEELLDAGFPSMVVDSDGEYYGLKEEYELLHVGADEECDIQIGPEHAERIATLALEENVPIVLDVSGYLDEDAASDLIRETARHLFAKEKKLKKPFLLVVEECHEYIPEGGGMDETGKMLIKIGKRGRKHGLGIVGVSQRPADVKKDFITQANWLVWHRLTWENDTKVVKRVVDDEYADRVTDLPDGRAFVQSDWTDRDVVEVQFRRKHTFDAGATPGLDDFERPELKSVNDDLVDDLAAISERKQTEQDRIASLERKLQEKEARIDELETELESAQDVSDAARQMAAALTGDVEVDRSEFEERLMEKDREINDLRSTVATLEGERDRLQARVEELETGDGTETAADAPDDRIEALERELEAKARRIERLEQERQEQAYRIDDLEATLSEKTETIDRLRDRRDALEATIAEGENEAGTSVAAGGTGDIPEDPEDAGDGDDAADAVDADDDESLIDADATSDWPTVGADTAADSSATATSSQTGDSGSSSDAGFDPLDPSRTDAEVLDDDSEPDPRREEAGASPEVDTAGGRAGIADAAADDRFVRGSEESGNDSDEDAAGDADVDAEAGTVSAHDTSGADQATVEAAVEEAIGSEGDEASSADPTGTDSRRDTAPGGGDGDDADDGSAGAENSDDEGAEVLVDDRSDPLLNVESASIVDLILADPVTERILMAYREARCNERHTWEIVTAVATRGPLTARDVLPHTDAALENVQSLLGELRKVSLVRRFDDGRYAFDRDVLEAVVQNPQRVDGLDDPDFGQRIE